MYRALLFLVILTGGSAFARPPITATSPSQPLIFEPNQGQAPAEAKWIGHGSGYELLFTSEGMQMIVGENSTPSQSPLAAVRKYSTIQLKLEGSRPWNSAGGLGPTGGVSNYLHHGRDAKPLTGIPHYARLRVADV